LVFLAVSLETNPVAVRQNGDKSDLSVTVW
jgi:hypothetical protein